MEKLSHRVHNLRDRKFRGEPRLLVPKVSSSDQQQFIKFWNGKNQCTMFFPMEIEMFEILNYYFSSRWCKVVKIVEGIFGFTCFVKYVQSYIQNTWRGVWRVWNLVCRAARLCLEKKFKIAFFSEQPFIEQISSKYFLPIVSSKHLKGQLGPLVNHVTFF